MSARIRAVLFDLDGTLVDTLEGLSASVNHALKGLGRPQRTREEVRGFIGEGVAQLLRDALGPGQEPLLEKGLALFTGHYLSEGAALSALYPGVKETLERLGDYALGVVTNKPEAPSMKILRALGIAAPFKAFVCGDTLPVKKPDPRTVEEACRRLNVPPQAAVLVGDSAGDMKAAHGAGAKAWGVSFGYRPAAELQAAGADALAHSFADVIKLLEEKS